MNSGATHRAGRVVAIPALYLTFAVLFAVAELRGWQVWIPGWFTLGIIATMVALEHAYRYPVFPSQRSVLRRDIMATIVNLYVTGAATWILILPGLILLEQALGGRATLLPSPKALGPIWLQSLIALAAFSLMRYWIHRIQHKSAFLWKLHSYHHRVTGIRASNLFASHPADFALRNVLPIYLLAIIGFEPSAVVIGTCLLHASGDFSHCGADLRAGWLSRIVVTPELHRWHHASKIPDGHRDGVNFGVGFAVWDRIFGTYHLPIDDTGAALSPTCLGDPNGRPDEPSYIQLLLEPVGLGRRSTRSAQAAETSQPD